MPLGNNPVIQVPNFGGGYRTCPIEVMDCKQLQNMLIDADGSLYGRSGFIQVGSDLAGLTDHPTGFFTANISGTPTMFMSSMLNLYKLTESYLPAYSAVWTLLTPLTGGLVSGWASIGSFVQFEEKILFADGREQVAWSATPTAAWTTAFAIEAGKRVMMLANDENYVYAAMEDNEIRYCTAGDPLDWPTDNNLIPGGNRSKIYDMQMLFGTLYIFKSDGIYVKRGLDEEDFTIEKVSNDQIRSRVSAGSQGIYFMTDGMIQCFSGSDSKPISLKIKMSEIKPNQDFRGLVYYSKKEGLLYVPIMEDNVLFVYDVLMDRWTKYVSACCSLGHMVAMDGGTSAGGYSFNGAEEGQVLFSTYESRQVYKGFTGTTDCGSDIVTKVTTKYLDDGNKFTKRPMYIYLDAQSFANSTMVLKSDYGSITEKTFTTPARVNFCSLPGTPRINFTVDITGKAGLKIKGLDIEYQTVTV